MVIIRHTQRRVFVPNAHGSRGGQSSNAHAGSAFTAGLSPEQLRQWTRWQSGKPLAPTAQLELAKAMLHDGDLPCVAPLLPLMLSLDGAPYSIDRYKPFQPLFNTRTPHNITFQTGRQVGKTVGISARGVIMSGTRPHFKSLYVCPLFEMVRRLSANYVAPFIRQSPMKSLLIDTTASQNVLQRDFKNQARMYFTFAFQDCERTRGFSVGLINYDEVQSFDPSFIPIIAETMSAAPGGGVQLFTGTPLTLSGTLAGLWEPTSQAQWHIICQHCRYENIPSTEYDLDRMTGPDIVQHDISVDAPGLVCAKCGLPLRPETGRWVHHRPDRLSLWHGYHIPQQILPLHYADPEKWVVLLGKRAGFGDMTPAQYQNEVCGESCDDGARLVTQTELIRACDPHRENKLDEAKKLLSNYTHRIVSVDWGGGGIKRTSFTVVTVMGLTADGRIDVLYAWRSHTPNEHNREAVEVLRILAASGAQALVHDFAGAGAIRNTIIENSGYPADRIIPVAYISTGRGSLMRHIPYAPDTGRRAHFQLDKARSLVLICNLIRYRRLSFFRWDGGSQTPLITDFLALTENLTESAAGNKIYTIIRDQLSGPDDFAHAVNMGACSLFHMVDKWPNLADIASIQRIQLDPQTLDIIQPPVVDWGDVDLYGVAPGMADPFAGQDS